MAKRLKSTTHDFYLHSITALCMASTELLSPGGKSTSRWTEELVQRSGT